MRSLVDTFLSDDDVIPLGWAGSTTLMDYLNFEDAISPVITAMVGGRSIRRVPAKSQSTRMSAIGAIGHTFEGGRVHVWGTGCSVWKNPSASPESRMPFCEPGADLVLHATSGPIAERLMANGGPKPQIYGDPAWLLPHFYRPRIRKKWKLGVILHLSEVTDRSFEALPLPAFERYLIPSEMKDDIHLITMVTPLGVPSLKNKLDEILACERIVSMTMHGLLVAEAYGIPSLYFSPHPEPRGLGHLYLDPDGPTDLRIVDFYLGLGRRSPPAYFQDRLVSTDWSDVINAIDRAGSAERRNATELMEVFPFGAAPLKAPSGKSIWEHPIVKGLTLQHDVGELLRLDKLMVGKRSHGGVTDSSAPKIIGSEKQGGVQHNEPLGTKQLFVDKVAAKPKVPSMQETTQYDTLLRMNADRISVPLSWAATTRENPHANLGDTLSAMVVAGMAGVPARRAGFDQPIERMVAVGTIGHNQRNGILHFWGTGVDAERNPVDPSVRGYIRPADTEFRVHAMRGPNSARTFRAAGIDVPEIYGDPVWMLPRFWPMKQVEKTHDLGVILHITEMDGRTPESRVKESLRRYAIPEAFRDRIRLINTHCPPTVEGMRRKVAEIISCRAIVSTSLHGLVISETYGIPCSWFATYGSGEVRMLDLTDPQQQIDHRMRDFYLGAGRSTLSSYCLDRSQLTNWGAVLDWVHNSWRPLIYDDRRLIRAFPVPLAVSPDDPVWPLPPEIVNQIEY